MMEIQMLGIFNRQMVEKFHYWVNFVIIIHIEYE